VLLSFFIVILKMACKGYSGLHVMIFRVNSATVSTSNRASPECSPHIPQASPNHKSSPWKYSYSHRLLGEDQWKRFHLWCSEQFLSLHVVGSSKTCHNAYSNSTTADNYNSPCVHTSQ
jgi:hypothetical protein